MNLMERQHALAEIDGLKDHQGRAYDAYMALDHDDDRRQSRWETYVQIGAQIDAILQRIYPGRRNFVD